MGKMYSRVVNGESHKNYPVNIEYYNSANDMVDDLKIRKLRPSFDKPSTDSNWTGCKDIDEAYEYLRTGYSPVVEKLEKEFKIANQQTGEVKRITFQNNILGHSPIVPLAMMGVPNSMMDMTMKPIKTKVVDIYYDMTSSASTSSHSIISAGLCVLSVVCDLERQGYRFNLYTVYSSSDSENCDVCIIKIKDARQPIDLRRMSFPLCHTGFFRLISFDWYGKNPKSTFRWGYGHTVAHEFSGKELKQFTKTVFGDTAILILGANLVTMDKEAKKKHLKEVLTNVRKSDNEG